MHSPTEALKIILQYSFAMPQESLTAPSAHGQILSEAVYASHHHPPADNSAMDGFALRADDCRGANDEEPVSLKMIGRSRAGEPFDGVLGPGEVVRIFTGALVPAGADVVEMQEYVRMEADRACFSRPLSVGAHIRRRGENFEPGSELMPAGALLQAAAVGLLCSAHVQDVRVHRRPKVAILGTGDELVALDEAVGRPETLVDSNGPMLSAYCAELGVDVVARTTCEDSIESVANWLLRAMDEADVILSTGGASVGEHDVMAEAWEAAGIDTVFWKIAMKPGKPLRFGVKKGPEGNERPDALVFALPGNPLSALTGFERYVSPSLRKMLGHKDLEDPKVRMPLSRGFKKKAGRTHFTQCALKPVADGWAAEAQTHQGSFMLRAAAVSELVGIFPAESSELSEGDLVEVYVRPGRLRGKTLQPLSED